MSYVAIDPAAVSDLARALDTAAERVDASRVAVDTALRSVGRSATAPARLGIVGEVARASSADLRRRLRELAELQTTFRRMGEPGTVYPRPATTFRTYEEAEQAGKDLAGRFAALFAPGSDDYHDGNAVRPLLDELARHQLDPHFCRAFVDELDPRYAMIWIRQFGEMSGLRDFPYRDDAVEPFLTAMGTGLAADPAALARYLGPMKGMLQPGDIRDVLNYGSYDDDTVLDLVHHAMTQYVEWGPGMDFWGDDPGLLDQVSRDPALAQRFVAMLDDGELRTLMGSDDYGLLAGFGTVAYAAGHGSDDASLAAVERLVVVIGEDDTRLSDDVQAGIARTVAPHLDLLGGYVADGAYPGDLGQDDLVGVLVRLMEDNDVAFNTLHEGGADLTADLLVPRAALTHSSRELAVLGSVYGLLANADSDGAIDRADAAAGWWAMAATGVSFVPLPGPALAGAVVKKTFATILEEQAAAIRARGVEEAGDLLVEGYEQGHLLIATAIWQFDQREHPDVQSPLTPPRALRNGDGSLKVWTDLDTPAEKEALRDWLAQPTPYTVRAFDGTEVPATVGDLARAIDDEFVTHFQKLQIKP